MTRTILITGCSSGLGRASARFFAADGWNVVATMRRPDPSVGDGFADNMLIQPLDVTDPTSAIAAVAAGVARFGRLDAVVNNAGVSVVSVFEATPIASMLRIFDTNVFGVMNVIQAALPALRSGGGGTVINVTSGVGFVAVPLLSLYVASKHAVEGLSESLSYELESQNIRVRLVEPGAIRTTRFSANTVDAMRDIEVPATYRAYFDHALKAMVEYPFDATEEQVVVGSIYTAATDTSQRLRYPIGPDIAEYARLRWSTSEGDYSSEMARLTGQTAWREKAVKSA